MPRRGPSWSARRRSRRASSSAWPDWTTRPCAGNCRRIPDGRTTSSVWRWCSCATGVIGPPCGRIEITSDLPAAVGVASSAALEVATARALGAGASIRCAWPRSARRRRTVWWAHRAGSWIRSRWRSGHRAPCCRSCAGRRRWPTRWRCRKGWSSLAGRRELPMMSAGSPTAAPGRRPSWASAWWRPRPDGSWPWVSQLPRDAVEELPEMLDGRGVLGRVGSHGRRRHPCRPGARRIRFGPPRCSGSRNTCAALPRSKRWPTASRTTSASLMAASQRGYDAMGLGHPAATAVVEEALARPGVLGARSSGGGCGGTVVVVSERGALDGIDGLIL